MLITHGMCFVPFVSMSCFVSIAIFNRLFLGGGKSTTDSKLTVSDVKREIICALQNLLLWRTIVFF